MVGLRLGAAAAADQLRVLLISGVRHSSYSACAFSTAPQQRNPGTARSGGSNGSGGDGGSDDDQSSLQKKTMKLEAEVQELKERYERAVHDSEYVLRRTKKFVEDAKLFGIQSLCRDLVEVADLLEVSLKETKESGMIATSEILIPIDEKLQRVFKKHGLKKMTPVGGDYDPYDHEVVCHVPAEGRRPGSVATIRQEGYKLHGRTIRHARVGIAVLTPK
ncbi:grpE protein homolog 2, mitochondrial [Leptodactylus fuscus]|uniref:grpE protein homolog 2, mitochondrial n=1 Tax=Leptodactylus fuscus TaxID=238119 RepID=UPI003F4EB2A9